MEGVALGRDMIGQQLASLGVLESLRGASTGGEKHRPNGVAPVVGFIEVGHEMFGVGPAVAIPRWWKLLELGQAETSILVGVAAFEHPFEILGQSRVGHLGGDQFPVTVPIVFLENRADESG